MIKPVLSVTIMLMSIISQARSDDKNSVIVKSALSFLNISNFVYFETSEFELTSLSALQKDLHKSERMQTIRRLTQNDTDLFSTSSVVLDFTSNYSFVFTQSSIVPLFKNLGICCKSLIILQNAQKMHNSGFNFKINQEVYFLLLEENHIAESYNVGNERLVRNLANFHSGEFKWKVNVESNFLKRRSDFRQANLVAFACAQSPYLNLEERNGDIPEYHTIEGVNYEIVDPTRLSGVFYDMQVILEEHLNFTTTYIKCSEEGGWGDQLEDGSFSGMVGVVNRKGADLIGTSLTMTATRVRGVSYVHPIGVETYSLIMPSIQREEYGWSVFVDALSRKTWTVLIVNTIFCAFLLKFMVLTYGDDCKKPIHRHVCDLLSFYWLSVSSYFGGYFKPDSNAKNSGYSFRIASFIVSLFGVWVWSIYRASLTSELSVKHLNMPFDSLEGFLKSDYQLLLMRGVFIENVYRSAPKETIYNKIYSKNFGTEEQKEDFMVVDDDKKAMEFLLSGQVVKPALMIALESAHSFDEFHCQYSVPWMSKYPELLSMATPKDSPYLPFLRYHVLKHEEIGSLVILNTRWKASHPQDCLTDMSRSMGKEKTVTLFAIWTIGAIVSVIIVFCENTWSLTYTSKVQNAIVGDANDSRLQDANDSSLRETRSKIREVLRLIRTSSINHPGGDLDTFFLIYELEGFLTYLKGKTKLKR